MRKAKSLSLIPRPAEIPRDLNPAQKRLSKPFELNSAAPCHTPNCSGSTTKQFPTERIES